MKHNYRAGTLLPYFSGSQSLTRPPFTIPFIPLSYFIFAWAVVIIFPRTFFANLYGTSAIDSSYYWALEFFIAHKQHYQWGKDILHNYGPLSFLSTRAVPAGYYVFQCMYDLYLVAGYTLLFILFLKANQSFKTSLLFGTVLFVGMWEVNFLMQVFNILAIGLMIDKKRYYWLSFFILLNIVLSFYIKLNTVFISAYSLLFLFAFLAVRRKYALLAVLFMIFSGLNAFLINFLNVSAAGYFTNTWSVVTCFGYSQYGFNPAYKPVLYYGIAIAAPSLGLALYFMLSRLRFRADFFKVVLVGNIALAIMILFKQGFTRLDRGHYNQFLCLFPLVLYCLYVNCISYRRIIQPLIAVSIFSNLFFSIIVLLKHYEGNTPLFSGPAPLITYCSQLFGHNQEAAAPADKSAGGSYDYYSNQCINQKDNPNPNWHSRPTLQSIGALSSTMDSINGAYYLGPNAPDTIFYDNMTVDNRNPLWDDPQCKWVIFSHYRYDHTDNLHQLVLAHRSSPLKISETLLLDTAIKVGETVLIPQSTPGIITMYAHVDYTAMGKIRNAFFQPPHVDLLLNQVDVSVNPIPVDFRFVPNIFNDRRLILNYSLPGGSDSSVEYKNAATRDMLLHFNSLTPNVRSFAFQTDMTNGIRNTIRVKLYATIMNN